jgi:hypothetical protein
MGLEDGYGGGDAFGDGTAVMALMDPLPGPSDFITGMLRSVVETYSANLDWDTEWATDWDQADSWSTRESNLWVYEAIAMGLYGAFDIDIPFTDTTVNPFMPDGVEMNTTGTAVDPRTSPGSANVMKKGLQVHHIATVEGTKAQDFEKIFKHCGVSMNDPDNKVTIPHGGRHSNQYHDYVLGKLKAATDGLPPADAAIALRRELKAPKSFIQKNPHFVYNSAGGKNTGWRGMRSFWVERTPGGRFRFRK